MGDTPGRMLALLGLLQSRPARAGSELADRLEVTERTVRRDVERLRALGYPVEAVAGRHGGYRLGRGGNLPPLMLSDDEAVAVAIGVRQAVDGSVAGLDEAAVSALTKLDGLLPLHLAARVRAVRDNTASVLDPRWQATTERVEAAHLVAFARAAASCERVRFAYTDKGGQVSHRLVEPIGVVRHLARWYVAARDVDRSDWRTFRLDRVTDPHNVGTRFALESPPDPVELVAAGLAAMPYPYTARICLPLPVEEAARMVPRTVAAFESIDGATIVELGSSSKERMIGYLAGLRPACTVLEPADLRTALAAHAADLLRANAP